MPRDPLPVPLTRAALSFLPAAALQRAIAAIIRSMMSNHPALMKNLEKMPRSRVRISPRDVPHDFSLCFGQQPLSLSVIAKDCADPADASVKGNLETLLALLEGRIDSDKMFFSRGIEVGGNAAVIVALRNTLDREDVDLLADATDLLGPFAPPARAVLSMLDKAALRLRARVQAMTEERWIPEAERMAADNAALHAELAALKARLAKVEARSNRSEAA